MLKSNQLSSQPTSVIFKMAITFLTGPAGTGKTTYAVEQLRAWLTGHVPTSAILVLVPQLTLAQPYRQLLRDPNLPAAGQVDILQAAQ